MEYLGICLLWLVRGALGDCDTNILPNIVIILADDLGWNDVSFHGSDQFMTPNIDALAYSGVILRDYYTQPICTPTRAALLTGRHPIHNGMENDVIYDGQPWGLPLSEYLMSEHLQNLGYKTRAVGKWHLGFFKTDYTPTKRGFHSHYGNYLGHMDHFTHFANPNHPGYDFRRGLNVSWEARGNYTADLLTEEAEAVIHNHNNSEPLFLYLAHTAPHAPLQAPQEVVDQFSYIPYKKRQIFAAMVTKVDESVGRVTLALKERNMLNNSIILFLADNGGATHGYNGNVASNWPLRGGKDTLWEGGVHGVGLIWSPLLKAVPRVHHGLINVQDWFPTLLSAIKSPQKIINDLQFDGVSQWSALNNESTSPYETMLHNIDPVRRIAALRSGKWKIVKGRTFNGKYDGWYGKLNGSVMYDLNNISNSYAGRAVDTTPSPLPGSTKLQALREEATIQCSASKGTPHVIQVRETNDINNHNVPIREQTDEDYGIVKKITANNSCQPHIRPCLFDIEADPCELENVAASHPDVVLLLTEMLANYTVVTPNNKPDDKRSWPSHWNNTWSPWLDGC